MKLRFRHIAVMVAMLAAAQGGDPSASADGGAGAGPVRETRRIRGWDVHVHRDLVASDARATARAIELLDAQLGEIERVVPKDAVEQLRGVPLYMSPEYPGVRPRAEYHPDAGWLRRHGRDPSMARAVEFTNIGIFEAETRRMPNFVLHELAHAYHHRFLPDGFDNADVIAAFARATAGGSYDRVERWFGDGRPNSFEKAYAMTTRQEYFAETSEAFFSRNDFFPFTRDELRDHDPVMFALLARLWGTDGTR